MSKTTRLCTIEGCDRKHYGHGWCAMHYQRWSKRGDPLTPRYAPKIPIEERFWGKVNKTKTCWLWTDAPGNHGYGVFGFDGSQKLAHRVSYQWENGHIPDGLHIDHTCHNNDTNCPGGKACKHRLCVRPSHLEPVTPGENSRRGQCGKINGSKTHCPHGHEYTAQNAKVKQGRRYCRTCVNAQRRALRARKRGEI